MNSDAAKRVLVSLEEFQKLQSSPGATIVVQFGSKPCTRCPPVTEVISQMQSTHQFRYAYIDVHDAEHELMELFGISKLPAYALYAGTSLLQTAQAVTPEAVQSAVAKECLPILKMDEDF